jgi:P27 family predicted phage terminase small subunit
MNRDFKPPKHLSDRAKAIWRELVPARARSLGRLTLLQAALEALDRCDAAREAIGTAGLTTTTKTTGAVHLHPLLRVERESRQQFGKLWEQLHLGFDSSIDGIELERYLAQRARSQADD